MLNYFYFITKSCHLYFIKIISFATRSPDISSCITHCKEMMVCKGITFNRERCRLKYKMVDGVQMSTNIIRTLHSVRLACPQDMFVNEMLESSIEVMMMMMMMMMPIPGIVIIIMITVLVMISWRIRKRKTTPQVIQEIVEDITVVKQTASVYDNPTFDANH